MRYPEDNRRAAQGDVVAVPKRHAVILPGHNEVRLVWDGRPAVPHVVDQSAIAAGQVADPDFGLENGSWATCRIKQSCTACQMCAFFCPTGALSKTEQDGKPALTFRVSHCTNCRVCAEICYWKSLDLLPRVNLNKALEDVKETFTFDAEAIALLLPKEKSDRLMKVLHGI